jgi:peptidoglycan/LPS O-acetylase OafA/YrhL
MAGKGRLHALDGLRGLAALGVVLLHVWMYTGANNPDKNLTTDLWMGELRVCVLLFFVLSGFLLAQPFVAGRTPRLGRYIVKRVARIGPAYWVALAGAVLLLHGTGSGRDISLHDLPKFIVFAQNVFPETRNQLDPPMWSLHVEVSFYVLLPLIGLALIRSKHRLAVCGALILAGVGFTTAGTLRDWAPEITWTLPSYLATFSCGIAAAVLAHGREPGRRATHAVFLGGAAVVLLDCWWHTQGYSPLFHSLRDLPASIGFAAMLWAVSLRPTGVLGSAPLRAVGTLSYGVYLWHYPTIYFLQMHGLFPHAFWPAAERVLVLTFVLATASWFLLEKPVLALSSRALKRRAPARRREPVAAEA